MRVWTVLGVAAATGILQSGCAGRWDASSVPLPGSASAWRYDVVDDAKAGELRVEAWLPPGTLSELGVRHGGERFLRDAEVEDDGSWRDVPVRRGVLHVPQCASGCHLRYRFELRRAATALHDVDTAKAWGEVVEAAPSMWLVHPPLARFGARYRFRVRTPPGVGFVTGVFTAGEGEPGTYEADATNIGASPYAVFGPVRTRSVEAVPGATIDIAIAPGEYAASDDAMVAWVARSARTMARFLGCFPLDRVMVLVVPVPGAEVRHGETMGDGGASIVVELGEEAGETTLASDWVLPHEMAHLAVPSVSRPHHWIEEGLAVYLQPIARARAGELSPLQAWRELALGMPKGAPVRGDRGLDDATDWARTYWGGATFVFLADLEMRRRTEDRVGLEDALRNVLASGGSVAHMWPFSRLLDAADGAVGVPVMARMHAEMQRGAWSVDLPTVFRDLGVLVHGTDVTLTDDAPLAAVRRSITAPFPADAPDPTACRWASPQTMAQR
ncbi:MAG TPA: hypothetical protein VGL81_05545 [Polyangiaceae bacterium]|jgi:hypothetical protein